MSTTETRLVKLSFVAESQIEHALRTREHPAQLPAAYVEADARIADGEIGDAVMQRLGDARAVRVRWSLPGRVDLLVGMDDGAVVHKADLDALRGALSRTPPAPHVEVHVPDQRPRAARAQRNADGTIDITYDNGHPGARSPDGESSSLATRPPFGFRA